MQKGLVLGKFMPLHNGHIKLIEFAQKSCDQLIVLVCTTCNEPIRGQVRFNWLKDYFKEWKNIDIIHFYYDEKTLPNTSESSEKVSQLWANVLKVQFPSVNCFISSEPYGEFVARFMGIKAIIFDVERSEVPISATLIRSNPYKYWNYLPDEVKKYYYRKVCVVGTESTGKSTLVRKLANYFNSDFVDEVGREVVEMTDQCTFSDLEKIAKEHARRIIEKDKELNKILFVDTDVFITKSYARFLFSKDLHVDNWILKANSFDLYLYLENDVPFVQDGTRLSAEMRNKLDISHKEEFDFQQINYLHISGSWEEKFNKAVSIIKFEFNIN